MRYLLFAFAVMMFVGCAMNDPYNRTMPNYGGSGSSGSHHDSDGEKHHHDKR